RRGSHFPAPTDRRRFVLVLEVQPPHRRQWPWCDCMRAALKGHAFSLSSGDAKRSPLDSEEEPSSAAGTDSPFSRCGTPEGLPFKRVEHKTDLRPQCFFPHCELLDHVFAHLVTPSRLIRELDGAMLRYRYFR